MPHSRGKTRHTWQIRELQKLWRKQCVDKSNIEHELPKKIATDTVDETVCRREQNKTRTAKARATETVDETICRREQNKTRTAKARATETVDATICRREQNKTRTAKARATETVDRSICRREQDKTQTAKKRAAETVDETMCRREQNKTRGARKRASESDTEKLKRRQNNKMAMANKRASSTPIEDAILNFHSKSKLGPDFVCVCCHRLMYKQNVVAYSKNKYANACSNLMEQVFAAEQNYMSPDGKQWVCKTCDRALGRGTMPLQAKANGLQLCCVPPELTDLNPLELRLISLRVPFMKMVALPAGK